MGRRAAFFPIALALGVIILAPRAGGQAQDAREGPTEIEKCRTIDKPGSYKLVNNLTFTGTTGVCLQITADFVTIDLDDHRARPRRHWRAQHDGDRKRAR